MLKNLENKGDPWGMGEARRLEWTEELDFEVPVVDGPIGGGRRVPVLGRLRRGAGGPGQEDHQGHRRAAAHGRGQFAVLGPAETCTGDPARRIGNEFVSRMLAQQNIETLNEAGAAQDRGVSCPHCFNTIANEYPQLGGNYEVIHHTQLLARLVEQGKLTPVDAGRGEDHLSRPVLPRPAQPGVHPAPGDHGAGARRAGPGDAPVQGARVLLRRGRGPDVDGGADRQADQHRADRRGARHRSRHHLHRLPLLPGHARRRRRPPRRASGEAKEPSKSWTWPRSWPAPCGRPRRPPAPHRPPPAAAPRPTSPRADQAGTGGPGAWTAGAPRRSATGCSRSRSPCSSSTCWLARTTGSPHAHRLLLPPGRSTSPTSSAS